VINAANRLADQVGVAAACRALRLPRSSLYRDRTARHACLLPLSHTAAPARRPPLALSELERRVVLDVLNSPRFANCAPAAIHAQLLDEGRYVAPVRTMYRLLQGCAAVRERRNQLRHPEYTKPELLAVVPNQVWSWDITKLKGPIRGTCFHLYVILDIFSRYVVGWMVAEQETAELAEQFIADTAAKECIAPGALILHADRGSSMRSKPVATLLCDLGIVKSHSRPYVSDDNPYSEAQFKTMKYQPGFPARFGSLADARASFRHRHDDAGKRPHRPRRRRAQAAPSHSCRRLCSHAGPLQALHAAARKAADSCLDQPINHGEKSCLKTRFRLSQIQPGVSNSLTRSAPGCASSMTIHPSSSRGCR
jgi:transposase InsO family protein